MEILGLVFAGTATDRRPAMARFLSETLGLTGVDLGMDADVFALPDGTHFAVAGPRGDAGGTSRTIGFLVDDLDAATAELRAAGIAVGDPGENDRQRYTHFHAPDGELYELIQDR